MDAAIWTGNKPVNTAENREQAFSFLLSRVQGWLAAACSAAISRCGAKVSINKRIELLVKMN